MTPKTTMIAEVCRDWTLTLFRQCDDNGMLRSAITMDAIESIFASTVGKEANADLDDDYTLELSSGRNAILDVGLHGLVVRYRVGDDSCSTTEFRVWVVPSHHEGEHHRVEFRQRPDKERRQCTESRALTPQEMVALAYVIGRLERKADTFGIGCMRTLKALLLRCEKAAS
jgi:hypothetical protein